MKYNYNYIFSLLRECHFENRFYANGENYKKNIKILSKDSNIRIREGTSKLVCVPMDSDYVIKIPFNMVIDEWDGNEIPQLLIGATTNSHDEAWDYCALEVFLYNAAIKEHIDCAFPKTEYVGLINDWPIYIQEKCYSSFDYSSPFLPTRRQKETVRATLSDSGAPHINLDWMASYYSCYGIDLTQQLIDFINYYEINDLHIDNLGYAVKDSRPVIIDFSGYKM